MQISEIRNKIKKYSFVLIVYGLMFEMVVGYMRKKLLIDSTLNNDLENPLYTNLSPKDLKQLKMYGSNR